MEEDFFFDTLGTQAAMMESIAAASDPDDMFNRLEHCGYFLRIDQSRAPQMFHGATVSKLEIEALRRITNVVRMGHVQSIGPDLIKLDDGTIPTTGNTVHVDCSARAVVDQGAKPVFMDGLITPQLVRPYQPVFSAALIAHVELAYGSDEEKNKLCGVVPLPNTNMDFIRFTAASLMNQYQWSQDPGLQRWIAGNRLDGATSLIAKIDREDQSKWAVLERIKKSTPQAAARLQQFLAGLEA